MKDHLESATRTLQAAIDQNVTQLRAAAEANRRLAWEGLCEKLEKRVLLARAIARSEQEKERRRNRPKPARRKRIMVVDKRRRGEVKSTRARVRDH